MEPRFEPLRVSFATADAESPECVFRAGELHVTFRDWHDNVVNLVFHDVAAYSWDAGEAALDIAHRDDICFVVSGSTWLQQHIDVGSITPEEGHRHYKLCFNAVGILQVISTKLELVTLPRATGGMCANALDLPVPEQNAVNNKQDKFQKADEIGKLRKWRLMYFIVAIILIIIPVLMYRFFILAPLQELLKK